NPIAPDTYRPSHLDMMEGHNRQVSNDWIESRIQQLHVDNERQKKDMETRRNPEDPSLWIGISFERRQPSFNISNQQVGLNQNHPFAVGSYGSNAGASIDEAMSGVSAIDHGGVPINALGRQNSLGIGGLYNDKVGPIDSFSGDAKDRMTVTSKRPENILLKRPPVPRVASSHEGLSELATNSDVKGRSVSSMISPEVLDIGV
ncbi:hypothetical protein Tco_1424506, partial [Tanacetum coccineum]